MSAEPRRLRVILVDDEASARSLLREYLAERPDIDLVSECTNGFEAVKAVAELAPDLLLLDVQMPKLSGFEVLELVTVPAVIFVTAYDEYALRAFEVHAVDYLLKPFTAERLDAALQRARDRLARGQAQNLGTLARTARETRGDPPHADRVLVREGSDIRVIPVSHLDYAEARDDSVLLKMGKEKATKQQTLADLQATLDPTRFVRIHRSYLLNVERLQKLELYAKDSRLAILTDGTRLPVSRAGYARLKELL